MDETTPTPPPPPEPPPAAPSSSEPVAKSKDENTLGIVMHLLGFAGLVLPYAGNIVGPLILWLIKKAESPYLDAHGKEVLNFQISYTIYGLVGFLSCFVLIGIVILPVVVIAWLIFVIIGAIKASDGKLYRYPLTIRFIT